MTFQQEGAGNRSFGSSSNLNKTMIQQAKLEASIMREKKQNVKQSKQNVSLHPHFMSSSESGC